MDVAISESALEKINDVAEFIDDINTEGAGDRWVERLFDFIAGYAALPNVEWQLCKNEALAERGYSCVTTTVFGLLYSKLKRTPLSFTILLTVVCSIKRYPFCP